MISRLDVGALPAWLLGPLSDFIGIPQNGFAPNAERVFFIRHALRAGFSLDEIFQLTKIDRWFLMQIKEIVDFEEELAAGPETNSHSPAPSRVRTRRCCS